MPLKNTTEKKRTLDTLFNNATNASNIHSAAAAVETMDGTFTWRYTRGQADPGGTPMETNTPFNIASVTKLMIAAAILKLNENGRVEIDRPMGDYLPRDLINGIHTTRDGVDHTQKITVRHLLGHSSGIPDYFEDKPKDQPRLADRLQVDPDTFWSIENITDYIREKLTAHFPPQPLNRKRIRVRYSDTNFQLLITIIRSITGLPHDEAFQEMFFKPLNMTHTFLPGSKPLEPAPPPSVIWAGQEPLDLPLLLSSLGDVNSTLNDLLIFMRALINGNAFSNPETAVQMRQEWHTFGFPTSLMPLSPNWPIQYGLGMMRLQMPRLLSPFRTIPAVIGHTGVTGSWLFYCQDLDLLLAGTFNQIAAAPLPFRIMPKVLSEMAR